MKGSSSISNSGKIGTIGFSRGGIANIIFVMKNKNVDATVSLDGSIFSQGWLEDIKVSDYNDPENFRDPKLNPTSIYDQIKLAN